jgi:APA family basic amino acid/polyamine antiporter
VPNHRARPPAPDEDPASKVDLRSGTPRVDTLLIPAFCGLLAAAVPLGRLADATSIGTLFAFGLVNVAVVVLRHTRPAMPRTFTVPAAPLVPLTGVGLCLWLMFSLDAVTWAAFGAWMAVGLVVYFAYGCADTG